MYLHYWGKEWWAWPQQGCRAEFAHDLAMNDGRQFSLEVVGVNFAGVECGPRWLKWMFGACDGGNWMMQTGGGMNCGHSVSNGFCLFTPSKLFISVFITYIYYHPYLHILYCWMKFERQTFFNLSWRGRGDNFGDESWRISGFHERTSKERASSYQGHSLISFRFFWEPWLYYQYQF